MQKITPFLWFDGKAEEAADFYTGIFTNSKITGINHYGEGAPAPKGSVMTASFVLDCQEFVALNGGPQYTFSPAISFVVNCQTQEEVDYFWDRLTEGGKEIQCGWLQDKFGVSWQIVPTMLPALLSSPDPVRAQKAMTAMLQMKKIDIGALERAVEQA